MGSRSACSIPAASTSVFGISCACAWPMSHTRATAPNPLVIVDFIPVSPVFRKKAPVVLVLVMRPRHEQLGDQRRPSQLMRCADAPAGIAMKVLVERDAVLVVRIRLQLRLLTQHRPLAARVLQEDPRQAVRQFRGDLLNGEIVPRSGRTFHSEIVAVVMMKLLQRLDDEKIERKQDGSA